ncbi:hypothetical protein METBIDRAFT_32505 [Metschnikowia bicuspidata var. bicuspidata NRRL YB-4993]|uniref:Uncharacterized protein n=1 Tax=Metschnikowia bicuspidata var. bicuspidata NRRL YB-4993 TaxID=869754 RepID=A0A1A0H927_9ASCO|nr:hypothetical protein METBIDRAFT_32505 [Metschnikowia bicuspidata var. bicuspidata NRRL YB-4993]OBA20511.1 hypothetical protein METBIDRAFT_32505 [Metschnikowia bicuspidata var. bicuspidata NRRL YB-4993]
MNIYTRYVSGEHDKEHFSKIQESNGHIKLRPLSGQFDVTTESTEPKSLAFWNSTLPQAAFFSGYDPVLFGNVITMLYKNETTNKMCAVSVTKFGCNIYENMILDSSSRFWPACQNLTTEHRNSNVRKALAITNLKNFNKLWNSKDSIEMKESWDETNAGSLASLMRLSDKPPTEVGKKILSLDLLQELSMSAITIDVMYDNGFSDPKATNENNSIVILLGTQMEQLFDPLLEYSPQAMEYSYVPPLTYVYSSIQESSEVSNVIKELFTVQSNFTMELVTLLQDFIIPLRIHVLTDVSNTTNGAVKVNTVFPPTIDEVTRINCILNNSLKIATEFGYPEVFKVIASILPFFYKAFARHQANISCFHARFEIFLRHNRSYVFDNKEINRHCYTPKRVENIIVGSLFELLKLKLIIKRLYELVVSDTKSSSSSTVKNLDVIDRQYKVIIETIDSLGCGEDGSFKDSRSSRIFTPSGKILTELATEWPGELQYGWMSRKVLAIHELKSVLPESHIETDNVILIIFSDHLLFIDVIDSTNGKVNLVLPDVLMNSLVNQKPLPALANFPELKVRYWCDVKQLIVKSYKSEIGQNLTFTTYGDNKFNLRTGVTGVVALSYSMKNINESATECNDIISQICKAQILHKSSPFHLFKFEDLDLTRFYCAHDIQSYHHELSKSPIVILLNMDKEGALETLQNYSEVFIVLTLSYLNDHTILITGYNRENTLRISDIVSTDNINNSLREAFSLCMNTLFHSSSLKNLLIEQNSYKIDLLLKTLTHQSIMPKSSNLRSLTIINEKKEKVASIPTPVLLKLESDLQEHVVGKNIFFLRIFEKLKKKTAKPQRGKTKKEHFFEGLTNIPETGIPRGKKPAFKKLYKPDPLLREASTVSSIITKKDEPCYLLNMKSPKLENVAAMKSRVLSGDTMLSSVYSALEDEASKREDRVVNELERIPEDGSLQSGTFQRLGANMGSVRYAPKKTTNVLDMHEFTESNSLATFLSNQVNFQPKRKPEDQASHDMREAQVLEAPTSTAEQRTNDQRDSLKMDMFCYPLGAGQREKESGSQKGPLTHIKPQDKSTTSVLNISKSPVEHMHQQKNDSTREKRTLKTGIKVEKSSKSIQETDFASQFAANALENLNAPGISSAMFSKYRIYEELPLSILNNAEEENWTSLARDSYSNLQAELKAMKHEVKGRRLSSGTMSNSTALLMIMKPNSQQFDVLDDTFSTFEFVSYSPDNKSNESVVDRPLLIYDLDQNLQNSSSDFVKVFSEELERNFSLRIPEPAVSPPGSNVQITSECHARYPRGKPFATKETSMETRHNLTTQKIDHNLQMQSNAIVSDEEDLPSSELANALDLWNKSIEQDQESYLLTSSSSEKTLMNELTSPSKAKQSLKLVVNSQTLTWEGMEHMDSYDSIVYLSDIFIGEV